MELLRFDDYTFNYPNMEVPAISKITFSIMKSEMVLIMGNSGSGKSTLLKMMKKTMKPAGNYSGKSYVLGKDIDMLTREEDTRVGFVGQNPESGIVTDKVWHELAFGLENLGLSKGEIRRRVAEMAEYFGIQSWFRKSVDELSGGEKQILNLAAVMVMKPDILLLDEPTAQLSPISADRFVDIVEKINRELGTTVIIIEHRVEKLYSIADKVLVLSKGIVKGFDEPLKMHELAMNFYSPLKIYNEFGLNQSLKCPLTTRDIRLWLQKEVDNKDEVLIVKARKDISNGRSVTNNNTANVSIKDVYFRYEKKGRDVLRGTSLRVDKGEFLAVIGGNGSGKTTLLKIMSGLFKPVSGKVKSCGKVVYLPQNPLAVFSEITVEDELAEVMDKDISLSDMKLEVDNLLEFLGLLDLRKRNPYDLSGGQQQKLAIGKALLLKPDCLLLDEPTKGIDPEYKEILGKLFKSLAADNMSIVMVSHDLEFCAEYAMSCAMLFDGEIVYKDNAREFFEGNSFYTTIASRIATGVFPEVVTMEELTRALRIVKGDNNGK